MAEVVVVLVHLAPKLKLFTKTTIKQEFMLRSNFKQKKYIYYKKIKKKMRIKVCVFERKKEIKKGNKHIILLLFCFIARSLLLGFN